MKTYVATKNAGKLVEMQAILEGSPLELQTYPDYVDVIEGETSYVDNALLKARALAQQLQDAGISAAVLADAAARSVLEPPQPGEQTELLFVAISASSFGKQTADLAI